MEMGEETAQALKTRKKPLPPTPPIDYYQFFDDKNCVSIQE
jgi:hypothetical protein